MPISRLGYVKDGEKKEFPVISALPREMTMAEFALLSDAEKLGDIIVTDYPVNEESDYVEVTCDANTTFSQALDALWALADTSRLNKESKLRLLYVDGHYAFAQLTGWTLTAFTFNRVVNSTSLVCVQYNMQASNSTANTIVGNGSPTDISNQKVGNGIKFTLYYNDAHTFDFNTKAENCIYGDGNVKYALDMTGAAIASLNTVTSGTLSGYGDYTVYSTSTVRSCNRVCEINCIIQDASITSQQVNQWVKVGTTSILPTSSGVRLSAVNGNTGHFYCMARIDTDGSIYLRPTEEASDVYITIFGIFFCN